MPEIAVRTAIFVLAATFAWSAAAKAYNYSGWRTMLRRYRLGPIEPFAAVGAPAAEAAVAILILAGPTKAGAAAVLALLAAFSAAIVRLRTIEGDRLPCGCFGRTKERDFRLMLVRNALLASLASAILQIDRAVDAFEGLGVPDGAEAVAAGLTIAGAAAGIWIGLAVAKALKKGRV